MKILLAMSGGVDSSVVAHMLTEQGHKVIGVRFTLWSDPLAPALAQILPSKCCTTQNIARANAVAKTLAVPLHIVDLEDEFKTSVVDPYLEAHRKGLTPNPCIGCNRTIKFGKLLELAKQYGCEKLATGHYARVEKSDTGAWKLLEAVDRKKDQSYYLYGLTQEQLAMVLFPLGEMMKSDVYTLAENYGVPLPSAYRESQDLCFFPEKKPRKFLERHLGASLKKGSIVKRDGTVVGEHAGIALYTIGQRRGLGIGGLTIPLEVVEKEADENTLIVEEQGKEKITSVTLSDVRIVSGDLTEGTEYTLECRTRSLGPRKKGTFMLSGASGTFTFRTPQSRQSPGQSLVLYQEEEVIGGGVVASQE